MHRLRLSLLWSFVPFVVLLFGTSCHTGRPKGDPPGAVDGTGTGTAKDFSAQMQTMAGDVKTLVPYLYDREAFVKPENRADVAKKLVEFSRASHRVEPKVGEAILGDPLLVERTLDHLQNDLSRAVISYEQGQYEFARSVAKSSLSNCFQCHSVTNQGKSAAWDIDQLPSLNLLPLERADLLVATRKYDKALAYMEAELRSPEFRQNFAFDYEAMLRRYLALVIRVQIDPRRALAELDRVAADGPGFVSEQIEAWRQSLNVWAKEPKRPVKKASEVFRQVQASFARATSAQHFEKDHAGDVEYLRSTAILHGGLKFLTTAADQARAHYLLGRAYEVLDDLGSWNLHESYYEVCLQKDPKGRYAKPCYDRLEASLYMGFSGSAGTHLPAEEIERLRKLRELL